jgi:hypothetical protein
VLVNIFVAIILNAYDLILKMDPDANDASQFVSMVLTQVQKTLADARSSNDADDIDEDLNPNVLLNTMDQIEDEAYWDIFEGYFKPGGPTTQDGGDEISPSGQGREESDEGTSSKGAGGGRGEAVVSAKKFDKLSAEVAALAKGQAKMLEMLEKLLDRE